MDRSKPCAKCRRMIYASVWHTCPNEACYYHIPCAAAPPPPAEQASGDHVEMLREIRLAYGNAPNHFTSEKAALDHAIAALSQRPVVVDEVMVDRAFKAWDASHAENSKDAIRNALRAALEQTP